MYVPARLVLTSYTTVEFNGAKSEWKIRIYSKVGNSVYLVKMIQQKYRFTTEYLSKQATWDGLVHPAAPSCTSACIYTLGINMSRAVCHNAERLRLPLLFRGGGKKKEQVKKAQEINSRAHTHTHAHIHQVPRASTSLGVMFNPRGCVLHNTTSAARSQRGRRGRHTQRERQRWETSRAKGRRVSVEYVWWIQYLQIMTEVRN